MAGMTREDLISFYVGQIMKKEGMDGGRADREWLLCAIADVAAALEGKRPDKPVSLSFDDANL